jgi:hypothetical protein
LIIPYLAGIATACFVGWLASRIHERIVSTRALRAYLDSKRANESAFAELISRAKVVTAEEVWGKTVTGDVGKTGEELN